MATAEVPGTAPAAFDESWQPKGETETAVAEQD